MWATRWLCVVTPVCTLTMLAAPAFGATTHVPADQPTIQAAIDSAAAGDVIVVAPGTYSETIDFLGKAITLRSSGGPLVTVISGSGTDSVVRCVSGEGPDTILEGFTITGGSALEGGGMLNIGSSPTIRECVFSGNSAGDRGGGMYNEDGSPTGIGCEFVGNTALAMGGGMFNLRASPTVAECRFSQNSANKGGGIRNYLDSHPTVTDSVFSYNHAGEEGGGMDNRKNSNPLVLNSMFIGNTAASGGGGMHNYVGQASATDNPIIINCLFVGNEAPVGGGMRNNDPSPIVTDTTIAFNVGSGIASRNGSSPVLANSIVWGNAGGSVSVQDPPIVSYSDVEGGFPGVGNIDLDPLFVDPAGADGNPATLDDNDYHLTESSPAIDVGSNDAPGLPPTDLDGNPRIAAGTVDMGAFEFVTTCALDADCDDDDLCTTDTCVDGSCLHDSLLCDDGDACTLDSCDPLIGACVSDPDGCDDGDLCTVDSCDATLGCAHDPVLCAPGETCAAGICTPLLCDGDGLCEAGENCDNCPSDCIAGSGPLCGNEICEAGDGEDCVSCPQDCRGRQSGKPSNRYCCGDGDGEGPLLCSDSTCTSGGWSCSDLPAVASCCGDLACEGSENSLNCEVDCGPPPFCGDSTCDLGEDSCTCPVDCGAPPASETTCDNQIDDDCDGFFDCEDADCASDPACSGTTCTPLGGSCTIDSDCCTNKCRGRSGAKTCK